MAPFSTPPAGRDVSSPPWPAPGANCMGSMFPETQLIHARTRAANLQSVAPITLSRQRLEDFSLSWRFDMILLAYYCFSHLLEVADRDACLRRIAKHLKPQGRAVIHLPAPLLLTREVPPHELEAMRSSRRFRDNQGNEFRVEQAVTRMAHDAERALRLMDIALEVKDQAGNTLRSETATMHYACITADDLRTAADATGLAVVDIRNGFKEGADTELVAILKLK